MMKKWSFLLMAALLMIGGLIGCSQNQQGGENAPGTEQQGVSIDPPQSEEQESVPTTGTEGTGTEGDSGTTDPAAGTAGDSNSTDSSSTGTESGTDASGSSSTDSGTEAPDSTEGSTTDGAATTETQGK